MPSSFKWRLPILAVIVAWSAWYAFPLSKRINLGLDLQGGMHLVLRVDTSKLPPNTDLNKATETALAILEQRINGIGVTEPLIQRQGPEHILIQLPGETDRQRALNLIGQTALLEFTLVSDNKRMLERALKADVPSGFELLEDQDGSPLLLEKDGGLTGAILSDAWVEAGEMGSPEVSFRLNKDGARQFSRLTGANIGRRLAIVLDGKVQSAPTIQSRISDSGRITGRFTLEQAHDLALVLRAGALPAPVLVEEERTVGPTLGKDSIRAGLLATVAGGALVVVFMVGYYWVSGVIAVIALALNLLMLLGAMGYFHATLTLPGIAGIILTLGMAVDANVLIYERTREELHAGRPLGSAIHAGYGKAFSAILDSNVTTIIAAGFLYWFGTGPIRGFATTLTIGLIASMFTAFFVTRIIFDALLASGRLTGLPMAQLIRETKIDFIAPRRFFYAMSSLLILAGAVAFIVRGKHRYGIDFTGGLLQEYRFRQPVGADQLRHALQKVGMGDAIIQEFGSPTEWLIRSGDSTRQQIQQSMDRTREAFVSDFRDLNPQMTRVDQVGPTASRELRRKAWLAIAWSMVGILVYVALRFRHFDFGLAGVIALIHDVIVAGGVLCLTGRQIDLTIVAALLTIAGYSINDTIVIYDRVRENLRTARKIDLAQVINLSVNQTLGRTLLTSSTVILQVLALLFFGGEVLRDFSFCLLVGVVSGVYSTVYIASSFVMTWRQMFKPARA